MSSIAVHTLLTPEEYISAERKATLKREYLSGERVAISGASLEQNLITMNTATSLYNQLINQRCMVFTSDMRVGIDSGDAYLYPDVSVVCDRPRFEDDVLDTLLNPIIVIEVLSPSTETYDRGEKAERYKKLDSLKEYVLISQDRHNVEHYTVEEGICSVKELNDLSDTLMLTSVEAELSLQQLYRFIDFET
ncbi:Uma2 family endonuclease [Candidatus Poribacteria bacterium]|nr:Uma2 family endonuclease [Candidatus Poribacteria bacterium]